MSTIVRIKRSAVTAAPAALEGGELAYSELSQQLFIGVDGGAAVEIIGGKKFTDLLVHTPGMLTSSSALLVDSDSKVNNFKVDNLDLDGNTVSTTNTDGNLILAPNGTGAVDIKKLIVNGGSVAITELTNAADLGGGSATAMATTAAIKAYVDSVATGLQFKQSVRVAATDNVNLAISGVDPTALDGITLNDGDRVALINQTAGAQNGIYVAVVGMEPDTWVRADDLDEPSEVTAGVFFFVEEGAVNGDTGFVLVSDNPLVLGTDPLVFTKFTSAGEVIAGNGLSKTGMTLDVNVDGATLEINADALRVKADGINDSHVRLANNQALRARNAADDGDVSLIAANALDEVVVTGLADPVADTDAAHKKYVDDNTVEVDDETIGIDINNVISVKDDGITAQQIRLDNNTYLKARNQADDANVNLIGLNASDLVVVTGLAAPTNDTDAATKKYVDDAVDGVAIDPEDLAGAGLVANGAVLDVNVDDATLEIATDVVQIKADGVKASHIRLDNNTFLKARNQANDANINLIGLNASDLVVVTGLAAPTNDTDAATKKYVDDAIDAIPDGVAKLTDLEDVTITTPADGHILVYDATAEVFKNVAVTGDFTIDKDGVAEIAAGAVTNAMLEEAAFGVGGDTGTPFEIALGETLAVIGANGIEVDADDVNQTLTIDLVEVDGGDF